MIRSKRGPSGGAAGGFTDGAALRCPSCGASALASARFCSQCGARIAAVSDKPARPSLSERRQVTVLFCDLVGSTELAARLDPEEICQLMERYQDTCARAIVPFEGHIAQTLGDGLLVYFGYPEAHEDDAHRAVRAGLAIVDAVADAQNQVRAGGVACSVRVGIHTGLVVAGELSRWDTRADMALVGETPNIAARLQALARPNQVVIGPKTQRLVEGHFDLQALGPQPIKGLDRPLPVWEARRATSPHARSLRPSGTGTPLLGRDAELAELWRHWTRATEGEGHFVVIAGAAGIGKSRLAEALRRELEVEHPIYLQYHCSPYFQNSALHPIVEQIKHAASFTPDDSDAVRWTKLEQLLERSPARMPNDTALVARLLSLPQSSSELASLSAQRVLDDTVEVLLAQLVGLAGRTPLLMTLEDAHWIDPTTLAFLQRLSTRLQGTRILVVITHRTRFAPAWADSSRVVHVSLDRLGPAECRSLVEHLCQEKNLPARVTDEIVVRSDGLPLFVEELTKAVLESDDASAATAVPSSLQDSLTARLDRLGSYKLVAQLAACIGRSFSYALLVQISELEASQLQAGLLRLVAAELLIKRGEFPDAQFRFRHALVQNAAYESLLRSERKRVHAAIARSLETRPGEVDAQPEVIAQHWATAGDHERALHGWLRAGRSAQRRSAHAEALAHLESGLRSLHQLPRTRELDATEIELQLGIARSHTTGEGWSGRRVHDAYARALDLSRALGDAAKQGEVLWGLWADHAVRGELAEALDRTAEAVRLAESTADRRALLMADTAAVITQFCLGDFASAQRHADRIHAAYRVEQDADLVHAFSHDPEAIASIYEGMWSWLSGDAERAVAASVRAIEHARQLRQPFQLCYALINGSIVHVWRGEHAVVRAQIDEALELARESRIPLFQVYGPLVGTLALVERDPSPNMLAWLRKHLETMRASKAVMHLPLYELQLAAAYERAGDLAEAQALVERSFSLIRVTGERWIEPDLYRMKARLLRAKPGSDRAEVEQLLQQGLTRARALGANAVAERIDRERQAADNRIA